MPNHNRPDGDIHFEEGEEAEALHRDIEWAKELLHRNGFEVSRAETLEDIPPADREYSSAYYDRYGEKVTASGIAWEERMLDGDYLHALTHASEPPDPADYDPMDDRDYAPDYEDDGKTYRVMRVDGDEVSIWTNQLTIGEAREHLDECMADRLGDEVRRGVTFRIEEGV